MLLALRSLYESQVPQDVFVDLIGVSSNRGVGTMTIDIDVVGVTEPQQAGVNILSPARRPRRRRPRFVFPDDEPPPPEAIAADTVVDLVGVQSNRGVGRIVVVTPFDLTEDEILTVVALLEDE